MAMPQMHSEQIGWYNLPSTEERYRDLGTPAWQEHARFEPQRVPLYGLYSRDDYDSPAYVLYTLKGVRTDYYTPSLLAGVPVTDGRRHDLIGQPTEMHFQYYAFVVAKAILDGNERYELLPQYTAKAVEFESPLYPGEMRTLHRIVKAEHADE